MSDNRVESLRQQAENALQRYADALTDAAGQPVSDIRITMVTEIGNPRARVLLESAEVRLPLGGRPY